MDLSKQLYLGGSITIDTKEQKLELNMNAQHGVNTLPMTGARFIMDMTKQDFFRTSFNDIQIRTQINKPIIPCTDNGVKKIVVPGMKDNNPCNCATCGLIITLSRFQSNIGNRGLEWNTIERKTRLFFDMDTTFKDGIALDHFYSNDITCRKVNNGIEKRVETNYTNVKKGIASYKYVADQMGKVIIVFETILEYDDMDCEFNRVKAESKEQITEKLPIVFVYSNIYRWKSGTNEKVGQVNDALMSSNMTIDSEGNSKYYNCFSTTSISAKEEAAE